jgi:hypothetical protein
MKHTRISRTPDAKREDWFSGWEEFSKLSRGLMEEPDEEEDKHELLAVPPPTYDPTADDELLEKKKKKPDCIPGNPEHHGKAGKGKFAKKGTGASWSKGPHKGHRKDCKHGSRRSKGRFTKVACGRKKGPDGKPDPKGNKAKYRCYDGKKIREQRARQALGKLTHEEGAALVLEVVTRVLATQSLTEGKQEQLAAACKSAGFYSLDFFTQLQNQLALSADGKLSGD